MRVWNSELTASQVTDLFNEEPTEHPVCGLESSHDNVSLQILKLIFQLITLFYWPKYAAYDIQLGSHISSEKDWIPEYYMYTDRNKSLYDWLKKKHNISNKSVPCCY